MKLNKATPMVNNAGINKAPGQPYRPPDVDLFSLPWLSTPSLFREMSLSDVSSSPKGWAGSSWRGV